MQSKYAFFYCQKLVLLSYDKHSVLLARRKGEEDYNEVYSFIGGKMETTDDSIVAAMKREKDEEIGHEACIKIVPNESYNVLFRKKDGSSMIVSHVAAVFEAGHITLSNEYGDYKWVPLSELEKFEPKIANIPQLAQWAVNKFSSADKSQMVEV